MKFLVQFYQEPSVVAINMLFALNSAPVNVCCICTYNSATWLKELLTELITFSIDNKNLVCKIINEGLLYYSIVSGLPPPQSAAPPLSFAIGWDATLALHLHLAYRTLHCVINIVNITNTFNIILIIKHTRQDYMSVHTSYCI